MREFSILAALLCLAGAASVYAGAADALQRTEVIELPGVTGRIDHMAYDPETARLFVAALGNNSIEVVDTKKRAVIHSIAGVMNPQGVFVASGGIYVSSAKDGSCHVFDARTYEPRKILEFKEDADNIRFDPQARQLFVGFGDGALAVVDPSNTSHLFDIKLAAHPESFQLEKGGGRIFVNLPEAKGTVAVVSREAKAVVKTWKVPDAQGNFPMALDEEHHRLFIGCRKPAKLVVLDTNDGKVVSSLDCAGDVDDTWYDASRRRIYMSGGEGAVSIFQQQDGDHYASLGRVETAGGARTSFFVPETDALYVAAPRRASEAAKIFIFRAQTTKAK